MKYPSSSYNFNGITVTNTWIKTESLEQYKPVTQVYGIIFNDKGEILVCREKPEDRWQIPGGSPENTESSLETLQRELKEEVDVKVKSATPLGVQKVEMPGNPNKEVGELFYQVRYVALLDKLEEQTPDPDRGNVWERIFVPAKEIKNYIKWGVSGDVMFDDATEAYKNLKK